MPSAEQFAVTVGLGSGEVPLVIAVTGELDTRTAPMFGSGLDLVIDGGNAEVVLDLGALSFIDSSGLAAIVDAATRLRAEDRTLTLRSTPTQALQILEITGVADLVNLEPVRPVVADLGPEQRSGDHSAGVATGSAVLASDLARVGSLPASDAVVDAALRLVTVLASATIDGADGVSVSLERHGELRTVASSDDTVLRMDAHQYATGQGPCLSAAAEGHWFHIESLAEERRWPAFTPLAMGEGIASVLSTPLVAAERRVGALNIYSNTERAFGSHQQGLAALFATQASGILADAGADVTDDQLGERILDALLARQTIARAQGVVMARRGVTPEAAAATLHRSARDARIPLLVHASDVLASTGVEDPMNPRNG